MHVSNKTKTQIVGPQGALSSDLNSRIAEGLSQAQASARSHANAQRESGEKKSDGKSQSLASLLFDQGRSPLYDGTKTKEERLLADGYARMMHIPLGTELENISLEHWGYERTFAGTDGMPEGGFTRMITELAKDVESSGGQIQLGSIVKRITQSSNDKDGVQIEITDADSSSSSSKTQMLHAKSAIVTMPLAVLRSNQKDMFQPELDIDQREAIEKITVGNLNKVLLTYEEPFWSQDVGTFVVLQASGKGEAAADLEDGATPTLQGIFSSTTMIVNSLCCSSSGLPTHMTSPSLLAMIGGLAAKQIERFSRLEVAKALEEYLVPRLITEGKQKPQLKHTFYSRWAKQEFTRGATSTPVTVGNHPDQFRSLAEPLWNGSLYLSGEHTEVNHRGSIVGAIVSAQRSSDQVLKHLSNSTPSARH